MELEQLDQGQKDLVIAALMDDKQLDKVKVNNNGDTLAALEIEVENRVIGQEEEGMKGACGEKMSPVPQTFLVLEGQFKGDFIHRYDDESGRAIIEYPDGSITGYKTI